MNMSELLKKLETYADSDYLPMHMPGHKRRMGDLGNPFFIDITEIDGFDDLHHAEGILKQAEERAAELYGSEETHYLVNGSTSGILAAISGCTAAGGTVLLARNSHNRPIMQCFERSSCPLYLSTTAGKNGDKWSCNSRKCGQASGRISGNKDGIYYVANL